MMSPNERRIRKWERECERAGKHIPWVTVGNFGSTGNQERIRGREDRLVAHLHADGESAVFIRLAFRGGYKRVLSQVPLTPLKLVRDLAKLSGARYPWDQDHGDWAVMSTDVVAERVVRGSLHIHAFSVKQRSEIIGPKAASVANKLSIEETYWKYFKAKWELVISDDLAVIETDNIVRLYDVLNHHGNEVRPQLVNRFAERFMKHWRDDRLLIDILKKAERDLRISAHEGWVHLAAAVQRGALRIDLSQEFGEFRIVWLKN